MIKKVKPVFNKSIFWDTDFDKLDYDKYHRFVIERVFSHGDVADIRNCRRYYGDELIREVLLTIKFLPESSMYLAAAVIDEPVEKFRCYKIRQSNPTLLPY